MAKLKSTLSPISGKIGDVVHINNGPYKPHVRKAVAAGRRKNEPAFKEQYSRTTLLNRLAAEVNKIIKNNSGSLKPTAFYHHLLKRLRKEPLNNRFLLLRQLKDMEVSRTYRLNSLGYQSVTVNTLEDKLAVTLSVTARPDPGTHKADCYSYELLLLTWGKGNKPASHEVQHTDWFNMSDGLPDFDFEFSTARVVHWMLCLRLKLGVGGKAIGMMITDGMAVVEVGSLEKKDMELLKKRKEDLPGEGAKKGEENVVRVKATRVR